MLAVHMPVFLNKVIKFAKNTLKILGESIIIIEVLFYYILLIFHVSKL